MSADALTYLCGPCGTVFPNVGGLIDHAHHCGAPKPDPNPFPRFRLWGRETLSDDRSEW